LGPSCSFFSISEIETWHAKQGSPGGGGCEPKLDPGTNFISTGTKFVPSRFLSSNFMKERKKYLPQNLQKQEIARCRIWIIVIIYNKPEGSALSGIRLVPPLSYRYTGGRVVVPMPPQGIKTLASGDKDQWSSCDCIIKHIPLSVRSAS